MDDSAVYGVRRAHAEARQRLLRAHTLGQSPARHLSALAQRAIHIESFEQAVMLLGQVLVERNRCHDAEEECDLGKTLYQYWLKQQDNK